MELMKNRRRVVDISIVLDNDAETRIDDRAALRLVIIEPNLRVALRCQQVAYTHSINRYCLPWIDYLGL